MIFIVFLFEILGENYDRISSKILSCSGHSKDEEKKIKILLKFPQPSIFPGNSVIKLKLKFEYACVTWPLKLEHIENHITRNLLC